MVVKVKLLLLVMLLVYCSPVNLLRGLCLWCLAAGWWGCDEAAAGGHVDVAGYIAHLLLLTGIQLWAATARFDTKVGHIEYR